MTEQDPATDTDVTNDVTDAIALTNLFQPPSVVRDNPQWVEMYHALVRRLTRDSAGLPLDMAQNMLIERIASTYISISWYTTFGGLTPAQLSNLNELYLKFVTQFQRVLMASDEALRQDLLAKFGKITTDIVDMIEDDVLRQRIRAHLAEQFRAIGY